MIQTPVATARKSPVSFRFTTGQSFSVKPSFRFGNPTKCPALNSVKANEFKSFSSSTHHPIHLHCSGRRNSELGRFGIGLFRQLGFRVAGISNGGSGNGVGGGGGSDFGGSGGGGGGGNKWSLLAWYLSLLEKYPVLTKAVTSAILNFVGDLICQLAIDEVPSLDLKRLCTFTFLGLVLVGPTLHFWYLYLSKLVTVPGASGALLRLVIDQFIFAPVFIGVFLSTLVTLEGRPSEIMPKLRQEWFSSVLANWQLWIPFQFLNFRFVPQQFQVLAANFIALVWNVILSYKAHKEVIAK